IEENAIVEITLFNPIGNSIFSEKDILSTSKNSPFIGKNLKGKVYGIFGNNQLILK
ncbi:MAG: dihydroorotase, partial [Flavobacteriaceae bacterium CG_4_8_14_3_um_filter_31_8]